MNQALVQQQSMMIRMFQDWREADREERERQRQMDAEERKQDRDQVLQTMRIMLDQVLQQRDVQQQYRCVCVASIVFGGAWLVCMDVGVVF